MVSFAFFLNLQLLQKIGIEMELTFIAPFSYFNGEMLDQDTEELLELDTELVYQLGGTDPGKIDYLGVYCGSSLDWFNLYENIKFIPLFIGTLQGDFMGGPVTCGMIRGLNEYDTENFAPLIYQTFRERFIRSMIYFRDDLEISFMLRVLKFKNERISTTPVDEREMDQFINQFDFRRVAAFVNDRKPNIDFVNHLLREFGMLYFEGRLPFHMNEDEEKVLILMGLLSFSIQDVKGDKLALEEYAWKVVGVLLYPFSPVLKKLEDNDVDAFNVCLYVKTEELLCFS
ncbi:unnamed protein product [Citrullus colocynthis]|uniref:Possible tRNA binding domain-containing protein n=1 Tax=Citrullus colocynthis TaxID=252529 RepID=A0ABP0Z6A0_9ROSI